MRTALFAIPSIAIVLIVAPSHAEPASEAKPAAKSSPGSSKKEPVHLVVKSGAQLKEIFTYFPYPVPPTGLQSPNVSGLYQLTIDPQGTVSQIKIVKTMGPIMDVTALKTLIRWKAKPGPLRMVDVPWSLTKRLPGPIRWKEASHIPYKE